MIQIFEVLSQNWKFSQKLEGYLLKLSTYCIVSVPMTGDPSLDTKVNQYTLVWIFLDTKIFQWHRTSIH